MSAFQQESKYFTLVVLSRLPSAVAVCGCLWSWVSVGVLDLCLPGYRDQMAISSKGAAFQEYVPSVSVSCLALTCLFVVLRSTDAEGASTPRKRGNPLLASLSWDTVWLQLVLCCVPEPDSDKLLVVRLRTKNLVWLCPSCESVNPPNP